MRRFYKRLEDGMLEVRLYSLREYEADGGTYNDTGNAGEDMSDWKDRFLCAATFWLDGRPFDTIDALRALGVPEHSAWLDSVTGYTLLTEWPPDAPLDARMVNISPGVGV